MALNHYRFDLICSKFKYSSALFNITLFLVHVKCVVTWFINLIWTRLACDLSYWSLLSVISVLSILSNPLSNRDWLDNNARNGWDPSSLWETMTRLYYRAAHYGTQCQGCLIDAQTSSGMFVTPRNERDKEISWPTGSIWGDMSPACALFPDLEGLMPMMAHQFLFSGSISGIWASTELCYGRGK